MSKNVLIVESSTDNLNESTSPEKKKNYIMEGEFTRFKVKNRNDRVYTPENFLPCVDELLERKKLLGVVYGEYDHPTVFDTQLQRVSHTIESLTYDKVNNAVRGEIRILSTHFGKEAKALVDDGCPIFVSSRSAGVTNDNGVVECKKLFTFDKVADPGFATSRIDLKCLNESFNYGNDVNFRIYDLTQESNFNNLIMDNEKKVVLSETEFATREQVKEYSNYLVREVNSLKNQLASKAKSGADKEEFMSYYENTQALISKMGEYLDYLSEKVQVALEKTVILEEKTEKIVDHCDYLAETIENTVEFAEHIAENTKTNIEYTEYVAEKIGQVSDFAEHVAEHTKNNIAFAEHIAEHVENGHKFTEHVAENTQKVIEYGEYLKEHVENLVNHNDYLAETVENSIKYTEHVSENLKNVMGYTDYLSENIGNAIEFIEYTAESTNKSINYTERVVEALKTLKTINEGKTEENSSLEIPTFENFEREYDLENIQQEDDEEFQGDGDIDNFDDEDQKYLTGSEEGSSEENDDEENEEGSSEEEDDENKLPSELDSNGNGIADEEEYTDNAEVKLESISKGDFVRVNSMGKIGRVVNVINEKVTVEINGKQLPFVKENLSLKKITKSSVTESIKTLINEIKKKDAAAIEEPHFFTFLNQKQKGEYRSLSTEEREKVNVAFMETKTYASTKDVLAIMAEALNENKPTFKDLLVNNIPVDLFPIWESLNDSERISYLEQSEFYDLSNSTLMESFWRTRNYPKKDDRTMILESVRKDNTDVINESEREKFLMMYRNIRS